MSLTTLPILVKVQITILCKHENGISTRILYWYRHIKQQLTSESCCSPCTLAIPSKPQPTFHLLDPMMEDPILRMLSCSCHGCATYNIKRHIIIHHKASERFGVIDDVVHREHITLQKLRVFTFHPPIMVHNRMRLNIDRVRWHITKCTSCAKLGCSYRHIYTITKRNIEKRGLRPFW